MTAPRGNQRLWLVVHLVLLLAAAAVLVVANRGQWFFGDEWEFLVNRGILGARLGLFYPHNEHWSTLPILVYVALRNTVGLGSYWPYIGILIAAHLALTHLLWRTMLRAGALPAIATAAAALFSVLGGGAENLLWAFQIGFVGAVAFGWAGVLVVATSHRRPGWRDGWAVLLLLCSLMSAGIGVPMVVIAAVTVWITSRALWRPLLVGGVPAVAFLVWYAIIGRVSTQVAAKKPTLGSIFSAVRDGLSGMTATALGVPRIVTAVLLLALVAWCVWAAVRAVRGSPAATGLGPALGGVVGIAAFAVMIAVGRGGFGASRYLYIVVAMALPAVALGLTALCRRPWLQVVAVLAIVAVGVHNVQLLRTRASAERARESWTRNVIESAARLVGQGIPAVSSVPDPVYDPDITVQALKNFVARNGLPTNATNSRGELGARLFLQVAVVHPGTGPVAVPAVVTAQNDVGPAADASCLVPTAGATSGTVAVETDGRTRSVWLRSEGSDASQYRLQLGSGPSAPPARQVNVPAGTEMALVTNLPAEAPDLTIVPATPTSAVCTTP